MKYINITLLIALLQYSVNAVDVSISNKCSPVRLKNGRVRTRGRGKIIRFSCYEGFILIGNKYATCIRGEWDMPTPICVNSQCSDLAKPEHSLVVPRYDGAILLYFCEPGYRLIGTTEIYCDGRQWNGSIPYCRDTSAIAPTSCDFEKSDLCWWEQDPKHDFDWRRHNFETPSAHIGTGPTYDHTLGPGNDGHYLYIEASGRLVNDTARIMSPIYNSSLTRYGCFSFWYHMYGDTIGALRVYFKQETESKAKLMFNKEGNQGNQWINEVFRLPETDNNFQIIIEGIRGSNYVSDIAVDDVAILQENECQHRNNSINMTSDDDQIEIQNAAQSCRGRCVYDNNLLNNNSFPGVYSCRCTLDCAENSTCCPDYAEYCILDTFSETVNVADSTTILSFESTNAQGKDDDDDDIHNRTINFFSTKTFKTPSTVTISTTTLFKFTTEKIGTMENSFVTKKYNTIEFLPITISADNVNTLKIETGYQKNASATKFFQNIDSTTNQLPGIIGAIIGIVAGVSMSVIFILFIYKKRQSYKRGKNGSTLSEDSEVRFLTSDEILDFNIAKPNDYNEM
ncbi:MAM and LDL-receptor class A domain-containing protein 2-like isoform X1 [Leptopilina heterotoma]|uniref:MAM and LDL-receptor class A domain-containing protein 2-like isoform X1 n=2 Tax=Leptopilina heterotoma TaxID=63436 RepID=UPI001CA816A7|nr:MAM and LDL-receptor class A domain-containing protein 2-like isoform X1 [Leptopilina heterotoma]